MATTFSSSAHMTIAVPVSRGSSMKPGFFARLKAAIIESRMRAAEREIARYRQWHDSLRHPHLVLGLPAENQKDGLPF